MTWLITGLFGVLLLVHMARPRFEKRRLSSALFFQKLPVPDRSESRWRLAPPKDSPPLRLQLVAFAFVAASLLPLDCTPPVVDAVDPGLWVLVDTSAGMTAGDQEGHFADAAWRELNDALNGIERDFPNTRLRLSTFDLEIRNLIPEGTIALLRGAKERLTPRLLGTDLSLLFGLTQAKTHDFEVTHFLVISDRPAPDWVAGSRTPVIWRDVGRPLVNVGFVAVNAIRNGLTGNVDKISLDVAVFGVSRDVVRIEVMAPDKEIIINQPLNWSANGISRVEMTPTCAGLYHARLLLEDAYEPDNTVAFEVPSQNTTRVDWQLDPVLFPKDLGWVNDPDAADFRVQSVSDAIVGDMPTLLVGRGYGLVETVMIRDFKEGSMLLQDLHFDALEWAAPIGEDLPDGFEPVMRGGDGRVWLARREVPPAILIPGLAPDDSGSRGDVTRTVFFNALRLLKGEIAAQPLFHLTTPEFPQSKGNRIALHLDEGDTAVSPVSYGDLEDLSKAVPVRSNRSWWPQLLAMAVLFLVLERLGFSLGGVRRGHQNQGW